MPRKPAQQEAEKVFTPAHPDAHHGRGGSYFFDPASGTRTPAPATPTPETGDEK